MSVSKQRGRRDVTSRLREACRPIVESLERRSLLSGDPAVPLFSLPITPENDTVHTEQLIPVGDQLFMTGRRERVSEYTHTELLYVTRGNGDVTPLFTATSAPRILDPISAPQAFNGQLYFFAAVPVNLDVSAIGLYASDGTVAGTRLIKSLGTGDQLATPGISGVANGKLLFFTNDAQPQLWASDGTAAGTTRIWTVPTSLGAPNGAFDVIDGQLYVSFTNAVWRSDGTAAGTRQVLTTPATSFVSAFAAVGPKLFVQISDEELGSRVYVSNLDGTGMTKLSSPVIGADDAFSSGAAFLVLGNSVLFTVSDPAAKTAKLIKSDGTPAGTVLLTSTTGTGQILFPTATGTGRAVFLVTSPTAGQSGVWVTDGTPSGTALAAATTFAPLQAYETPSFQAAGRVFTRDMSTTTGVRFFESDGTVAGTRLVHYPILQNTFHNKWLTPATFQGRAVVPATPYVGYVTLWSLDPDVVVGGAITGSAYLDANRNGTHEGFERPLTGTPFIDLDANGTYENTDLAARATANGGYVFDGGLPAGVPYTVGFKPTGGDAALAITTPAAGKYTVTQTAGQQVDGLDFLSAGTSSVVWGSVFNDLDGDGFQDPGEGAPSAPQTIYRDANNNGRLDAGETSTTTAPSDGTYVLSVPAGGGTFTLRRADQLGFRQTTPAARGAINVTVAAGGVGQAASFGVVAAANAAIAGRVWDDQDYDGIQDPGEPGLANVPVKAFDEFNRQNGTSAVTDTNGYYTISNLFVDVPYRVLTTPPSNRGYTLADRGADESKDSDANQLTGFSPALTIAPGETRGGVDVGMVIKTSLGGTVFRDANENDVRDAVDPPVAGAVVFIDEDADGAFDPNELQATTGSNGTYVFNVFPGAYRLGVVPPAGTSFATPVPTRPFTLGFGQNLTTANLPLTYAGNLTRLGPVGGEFRVNQATSGPQTQPSVGADVAGNLVVAFLSQPADTSVKQVVVRRFGPDGGPLGGDIPVSTATSAPSGTPRVAVAADGSFVVAWIGDTAVYARRFASGGTPLGDAFTVTETAAGAKSDLRAAVDPTGGFALAWTGRVGTDDAVGVAARRYDAGGTPRGGEFRVNDVTAGDQRLGGLAVDPLGRITVAYTSALQDGSGLGVYGRRFDAAGAPLGGSFLAAQTTSGDQTAGAVAVNSAGRAMFVYLMGADLYGRVFNFDGTPRTAEFRVDTSSAGTPNFALAGFPDVAAGPNDTFLAAWVSAGQDGSGNGIFAQLLSADGVPLAGEFRVNTTTVGGQTWPAVAPGPDGAFTAAWTSQDQDGSAEGVYAQRFATFTGRATISGVAWTDADGNGVRSATETPVAGVPVELRSADGLTVDSTTTGADGTYKFGVLRPGGSYQVVFGLPGNALFSPADQGADDTRDSDADIVTGATAPFTAPAAGGAATNLDVGLMSPATVSGFVYYDADGDAIKDAGEEVQPGWRVYFDDDADGTFDANERSVVTLANGSYTFGGLRPGTYRINAVPMAHWQPTTGSPAPVSVTVVAGQTGAADFGFRPVSALTDRAATSGTETRVNTVTAGDQSWPSTDADAAGNYVVVWEDRGSITGQRYAPDGAAIGGEFSVSLTGGTQPAVAMADDGRFVVTWASGGDVYARRFTASGAAAGAPWVVNTTTDGTQSAPDVTVAPDGTFVIAWQSAPTPSSTQTSVLLQRYAADGTPRGAETNVAGNLGGFSVYPSVASDGAGNFAVAYYPNSSFIRVRRYDAGGNLLGTELSVRGQNAEGYRGLSLAMNAGGEFVVASYSSNNQMVANLFDADANLRGAVPVSSTNDSSKYDPSVRIDDDGRFVVTWQSEGDPGTNGGYGVRAQWFDGSGVKLGGELRVNTTTAGNQAVPDVALLPGGFVIAWASEGGQDGDRSGVYMQRYETTAVPVSVGGVAFNDDNLNGVRDAGEAGRDGITVQLLNDAGVITAATTTASGGQYRFDSLFPGYSYRVRFTLPASTVWSPRDAGGNDAVDSDVDPSDGTTAAVTYAVGGGDLNLGAGIISLGSISGRVYADLNANGTSDAGEGGLEGRIVFLDANDNARLDAGERSAPTGALGDYSFADLFPGSWRVEVVPLARWATTTPITARLLDVKAGQTRSAAVGSYPSGVAPTVTPGATLAGGPAGPAATWYDGHYWDWFSADAQGGFVTTMTGYATVTDFDVAGQVYSPSGAPSGSQFSIAASSAPFQDLPAVARAPGGMFVVAWERRTDTDVAVYARMFNPSGSPRGPQFRVGTSTTSWQMRPSVAIEPDGDFVVAWEGPDGDGKGIFARRFDWLGNARGVEFQVNVSTSGDQFQPEVATNAQGAVFFAWQDDLRIVTRRFDATGGPSGGEVVAGTGYKGNNVVEKFGDVAMNASGEAAVAWQSPSIFGAQVSLARFGADGTRQGERSVVSSASYATHPSVALRDGDGSAVVVWEAPDADQKGIYARQYTGSGVAAGPEVRVNVTQGGDQAQPMVSVLSGGGFIVGWYADQFKMAARRFEGSPSTPAPTSAAGGFVWNDADGDGVLDAGETAAAGVSVDLLSADGTVTGTALTGTDGGFLFSGLTPGAHYSFRYTVPAGKLLTERDRGADDARDSDVELATQTTAVVAPAAAGQIDLNYGAGLVQTPLSPTRVLVSVNGGAAQRSHVTSVSASFDFPVSIADGALKLKLLNTGGSGLNDGSAPTDVSAVVASPTTNDGGRTWTWTFVGTAGSLADGVYTMTLDHTKVTAGGAMMTDDLNYTFHRLFGDVQGNKIVNNADYFQFRNAFGKTPADAGYNAAFDFDGGGLVNNADYLQFRSRFGKVFSY